MKRLSIILLVLSFACFGAYGATFTAASASHTDVTTAIGLASDGDIVEVPAGEVTYTTTLNITKAIHLKGAGIGQTIINDGISSGSKVISITLVAAKNSAITGIEFRQGSRTITASDGSLFLTGTPGDGSTIRVEGCKFENLRNFSIMANNVIGVIADNDFTSNGAYIFIYCYHNTWGGRTYGDGSWNASADWSGTNWIWIENNRFYRSSTAYAVVDAYRGARYAFRFNSLTNGNLEAHGTDSTSRYRGTRAVQAYGNTFHATNASNWPINIRSGGLLVASNTVTGYQNNHIARLDAYRVFYNFTPWATADGTSAWDDNDAGGVFETNTSTGGGSRTLTRTGAGWTPDQWIDYSLRVLFPFTATSGGVRSVTVSGAGWSVNQWAGYMFRSISGNQQSRIASNTSDTLTLHVDYPGFDFSALTNFEIYRSSIISGNTTDTITVRSQGGYVTDYVFGSGQAYEIRRVLETLDMPGKGEGDLLTGDRPTPIDLNQVDDPIYEWANTVNGANGTISVSHSFIRSSEHYFQDTPMPGWTPMAYPHPLVTGDAGGGDPGPTPSLKRRSGRGPAMPRMR